MGNKSPNNTLVRTQTTLRFVCAAQLCRYMKKGNRMKVLLVIIMLLVSGCSTMPRHIGEIQTNQMGDEYSIRDAKNGFMVAGHYSEYQFIRNSKSGFTGCMQLINDAARKHAEQKNKTIHLPRWNEIEIVDHGRDLITAVMHVNCQYEYKFDNNELDIVEKLNNLKSLLDSGALTTEEYEIAKKRVLNN